jgi:hypothetical protein
MNQEGVGDPGEPLDRLAVWKAIGSSERLPLVITRAGNESLQQIMRGV